jgi:hypothetical protein
MAGGVGAMGAVSLPTPSFAVDVRPCLEGGAKRAVDIRHRQGPETRQPANYGAGGDGGDTPGVGPTRMTKRR